MALLAVNRRRYRLPAFYVITSDIPPFFFYTLLLAVGVFLLIDP
jgi:hypothetical protein